MDQSLWEQIRGHDQTIDRLRGVIDKGRPAHAYLFFGPRGVGKAKCAAAFAAALNCPTACGVCPSCRAILGQTHPDFRFIEPQGAHEILLSQITDLLRSLHLKKPPGAYKVAIIDDAHKLRVEAANALLKTLEEPPDGVVFVLVASGLGRVLATIASRCQRVPFGALDAAAVRAILEQDHAIDPEKAKVAAALAHGMVGEAVELAAGGLLDLRAGLIRALFAESPATGALLEMTNKIIAAAKSRTAKVKKAQEAELAELVELMGGAGAAAGIKKNLAARHKRELARLEHRFFRQVLGVTAALFRDVLLICENVDKSFVANSDMLADIERARTTPRRVKWAWAHIEEAGRRLDQNVSPVLAFENLFFALEAVA